MKYIHKLPISLQVNVISMRQRNNLPKFPPNILDKNRIGRLAKQNYFFTNVRQDKDLTLGSVALAETQVFFLAPDNIYANYIHSYLTTHTCWTIVSWHLPKLHMGNNKMEKKGGFFYYLMTCFQVSPLLNLVSIMSLT